MDQQRNNITQYLVPANVNTKFEFFPGFGWGELIPVVIAGGVGVLLFMALNFLPGIVRLLLIVLPTFITFSLMLKDSNSGMSLMGTLKSLMQFRKKQKRFLYKYGSATEE